MARKFPENSYTIDAQSTLAVEFINFAQNKINLYLDCKDPVSIQKLRAQIDVEEKQTKSTPVSIEWKKWQDRNLMKWVICLKEPLVSLCRTIQLLLSHYKAECTF